MKATNLLSKRNYLGVFAVILSLQGVVQDARAQCQGQSAQCTQCTFSGAAESDWLGQSVGGAGDVNADGYDDVIVGAPTANTGPGMAYIFSGLDCSTLCEFTGKADDDGFGFFVSGAGDVDGDGHDDVIVGSPKNDAEGNNAGRAYVYSGLDCSELCVLTEPAPGDGHQFGYNVRGAGNVNGDEFADVIVGAWRNNAGGTWAGAAYVYTGPDCSLLYTFTGDEYDEFGISVSGAGDINGDGRDDVIVGAQDSNEEPGGTARGHAYIYSGLDGTELCVLEGEANGDNFGRAVSGAGNVNGDEFDDVIIGAFRNATAGSHAGRAYVYTGPNCTLLHTLTGEAAFDNFGDSVSGAGDVNGDIFDDVIVGAARNDACGSNVGRAYVFSGRSGQLLYRFTGEADNDLYGAVSGAGDANGDGYADVIVGAVRNDAGGEETGRAYVYLGGADCNGNGVQDQCECPADLTCDGVVGPFDLPSLLGAWGTCP